VAKEAFMESAVLLAIAIIEIIGLTAWVVEKTQASPMNRFSIVWSSPEGEVGPMDGSALILQEPRLPSVPFVG
jgi:hypothetical protein